jgi:putative transposase
LSLGKTSDAQQAAYRWLFATETNPDEIDLIRESLHSGTSMGNDRFKKRIKSVAGVSVGYSKRGRPTKSQ